MTVLNIHTRHRVGLFIAARHALLNGNRAGIIAAANRVRKHDAHACRHLWRIANKRR